MIKRITIVLASVLLYFGFNNQVVLGLDFKDIKLGSIVVTDSSVEYTDFRLYAPLASEITLKVNNESQDYTFLMEENEGLWFSRVATLGNLHGFEYVYEVTTTQGTFDIIDPYAKAISFDGSKGVILDLSKTNTANWIEMKDVNTRKSKQFIYGLHVEDFSSHQTWNGPENYKGKFYGVISTETSISGQPTGFDYLNTIEVSHLELMPVYDFGIDTYSPGYEGMFPFSLSRRYAQEQEFDSPIMEFKEVIDFLNQNNKSVVMKVDFINYSGYFYNNMIKLVPDLFISEGVINVNNEFAKKYIIDLFDYYASEFRLGGFSIRNIEKYPLTLIGEIASVVKASNENALIYGGGNYTETTPGYFSPSELKNYEDISLFNYSLRDGLFGSLFNNEDKGLLTGDYSKNNLEAVKFALLSSINHKDLDYSKVKNLIYQDQWIASSTYQMINALSSYEGLTLNDKLRLNEFSETYNISKIQQAYLTMFLSGGIPYVYNGDEFLKTREEVIRTEGEDLVCYEILCFKSDISETGHSINWNRLNSNKSMAEYLKTLVLLRNNNNLYSLQFSEGIIKNKISFNYDGEGVLGIVYTTGRDNIRDIEKAYTAFNYTGSFKKVTFPKGDSWRARYYTAGRQLLDDGINIDPYGYYISFSIKQARFSFWVPLLFLVLLFTGIYLLNTFLASLIVKRDGDLGNVKIKGKEKYLNLLKRREMKKVKTEETKLSKEEIKEDSKVVNEDNKSDKEE